MNNGPIHFHSSCLKTLSAVEASRNRSNQHEFNGVIPLKRMFGPEYFKKQATFSVRGQQGACKADITWYDARENHDTRSEHRLYFATNPVMAQAQEGDNVIVGFDLQGQIQIVLIKSNTSEHTGRIPSWIDLS